MSFLENLAAQRQVFLDGLDANDGDINLQIFEDFYPEQAHFIYELLQNAEDAGATEVAFELAENACYFEHNGTRHFDEKDIRAITGISNSTKKDNPDKIGKFGVGFKSVFVYTKTPVVYSRDFCFEILKQVLPREISPKLGLREKTRFEFPFNNPKKDVAEAFTEVKYGLEQISETTLLFLNNLRYISWKIGDVHGAILREEHDEVHIEVLKLVDGNKALSSHWLRFAAPVENINQFSAPADGLERQKVAVAFELNFLGDTTTYDATKPFAKQLKISPAGKGKVSVFFPAEKETSGLRFHLHGPFIPELSRASIKNSPENAKLLEQVAKVAADSLHAIKEMGLLTGEFLAVLPHHDDPLSAPYKVIRDKIIHEMNTEALVPSYAGGFAPAVRMLQARASLKAIFSDDDLSFLTGRGDAPTWAIGASLKSTNQDKFLASLGINSWQEEDLKSFLEEHFCDWYENDDDDGEALAWLCTKNAEWHQALYAILNRHCEEKGDFESMAYTRIIRMSNGEYSTAVGAYFPTGPVTPEDAFPRVDEAVLVAGTKKAQQDEARRFFVTLGVKVPGELEEIGLLLQTRYGPDGEEPLDDVYLADLARMMAFADRSSDAKSMFAESYIFRIESGEFDWGTPKDTYLDSPFLQTGLRAFYESMANSETQRWPLSKWYLQCGIPVDKLRRFAELVGCEREFNALFYVTVCYKNPNWSYLSQAPGGRQGNSTNRDFALTPAAFAMLKRKDAEASLLVWTAMCKEGNGVLRAKYQRTDRGGPHCAESQLVCALKNEEWVPQTDGQFVKPRYATQSKLPEGFVFDAGYKWLEMVAFGVEERKVATESKARATMRAELGFGSEEEVVLALEVLKLPKEELARLLDAANRSVEEFELPEHAPRNVELRRARVGEMANQTPSKESVVRPRSVALGIDAAKLEAKLYLNDQYTNRHGQMICQICKRELPFKLPSGSYYFEAVEIVTGALKRFREGYLSLCPNHAAAYKYANAQTKLIEDLIGTASGNEIDVVIGGEETTIYFTQTHLADTQACLNSEQHQTHAG